jgi:molybdate transport system ATP-binding protein
MSSARNIQLRYAVERKDFKLNVMADIPLQGVTGIYGPSGAGKTTLLRCIAGLEDATLGELSVGDERWQGDGVVLPVHEREIGYVFQEPRLFSHLRVRENIQYGIHRRRSDSGPELDSVVNLLGLGQLLQRWPHELSGGEAQRVAIARALLRAPKFVLMDEPLASLDAARKNEILPFLDRLHAESSTPIIYVSHNIEEICRLCDHLIVLDAGQVVASGELQSVLVRLDIPAVAGEEAGSIIAGTIAEYDAKYDLTAISCSAGQLWLPGNLGTITQKLRLRIRANDISLNRDRPTRSSILNLLEVVIEDIQDTPGPTQLVRIVAGQERLIARITRRSREELNLQLGDTVIAQVKAAAVRGPNIGEKEQ